MTGNWMEKLLKSYKSISRWLWKTNGTTHHFENAKLTVNFGSDNFQFLVADFYVFKGKNKKID